ncbi:hypothetical protein P6F26_08300 [Roseibacterium sp. SDUM158017]|uniref:hypothetical protein n=1 Tax=Roseicyclus salinarum TaxID=3036773 RepID=UPI002414D36C|nr:hypothetical protein [Roseibacterium sp. SDUM158017]MDG4648444.1 hypothetical protein [Roseibacterium sp. SDUM158017]
MAEGDGDGGGRPTLAEKRAFLESGAAWPGEPRPDCVETHASLVFLTRDRAWKLRKPVRLVHVDQRRLQARERLCRAELRVNSEMPGHVYRGMTPLVQRDGGGLAVGGQGRVVDWLVETVRLPAGDMLDRRLLRGPPPSGEEIGRACDLLVRFYRERPPEADGARIFHDRLRGDIRIARRHLRDMAPAIGMDAPARVLDAAERAIRLCRDEILERGETGLIVEGHGDLRAEHVCLGDPPVVFDRLEIDHGLRVMNPFHEVNALGLECALLGAGWIRERLLAALSQQVARPSPRLLTAYGAVSCLTRARIAADHFRDAVVPTPLKWRKTTRDHVVMATRLLEPEAMRKGELGAR